MESAAILAYILFAASKLDNGNVAVVKSEFFEQVVALDSLSQFLLGNFASWDIINTSKKYVNWCISVHRKDDASTVFFDPAIKQGESHASSRAYRSRRNQLLSKIYNAIGKLYEVFITLPFPCLYY